MSAYVVVLATPWFARTAADGTATIAGVPPGNYRAEVWHPRSTRAEPRAVTVTAENATVGFKLALKPDRRIRRAPAAPSGGYR
jgi:hypothetical protein